MKHGSGILPITRSGKICLAWRSPEVKVGNCWGCIGGMIHDGLSDSASALVEMEEEVGYTGPIELVPAFVFTSRHFRYANFLGIVPGVFPFLPLLGIR